MNVQYIPYHCYSMYVPSLSASSPVMHQHTSAHSTVTMQAALLIIISVQTLLLACAQRKPNALRGPCLDNHRLLSCLRPDTKPFFSNGPKSSRFQASADALRCSLAFLDDASAHSFIVCQDLMVHGPPVVLACWRSSLVWACVVDVAVW